MDHETLFTELHWHHGIACGDLHGGKPRPLLELIEAFEAIPENELRVDLSRWVRETFLTEEKLEQGYGWGRRAGVPALARHRRSQRLSWSRCKTSFVPGRSTSLGWPSRCS
jgi:hypothetical protein